MPSAVVAPINNQVVTSFDILKPEIFNSLFRQYGKQFLSYYGFLLTMGFITAAPRITYSHFLEDWIHPAFKARAAVAASAAGAVQSITLSTDDIDSDGFYYPRLNDHVMYKNGVKGFVASIAGSPAVLSIYPDKQTDSLPAVAAGETMIIYGNRFGESTDQPAGRVSKATQESFTMTRLKEEVDVSGDQLCQQTWVDSSSDGEMSGRTWCALTGKFDAQYRMQLQMGGKCLFDEPVTNTTLLATDSTNTNTTGLEGWIRGGGNESTYTPGAFSISDFDYMTRIMDKYDAPMNFAFFAGINLYQDVENALTNLFTNNPIIFANGKNQTWARALYGENPDSANQTAVDIGFACIKKTNRIYHMLKLGELSNPNTFNATGFTKAGEGFVCPLDQSEVKTPEGGKKIIPRIGMRYLQSPDGGYSRRMETWVTGGAGNIQKTDGVDTQKVHFRSQYGTQFFGNKHFFLWNQA
jgi:hypothetical protein